MVYFTPMNTRRVLARFVVLVGTTLVVAVPLTGMVPYQTPFDAPTDCTVTACDAEQSVESVQSVFNQAAGR